MLQLERLEQRLVNIEAEMSMLKENISEVRNMPISERAKGIHPNQAELKELKLLTNLRRGVLENCNDLSKLTDKLLQTGIIRIAEYSKLKEMIRYAGCDSNNILLSIEEAELAIMALGDLPETSLSQQTVPKEVARAKFDAIKMIKASPGAANSETVPLTDGPTPGATEKHQYPAASGFCLILNIFVESRTGTVEDAANLKSFLESVNCRVETVNDPDLERVNSELEQCRKHLISKYGPDYFICAILSHGSEEGILTYDNKRIKMEDVLDKFKNDKMPGFVGKPKVFLVQACRGSASQSGHDIADDEKNPKDWSDIILASQIPTDADILLAFATTPGYKAHRRLHVGSWFVTELMKLLKDHYKTEHLEEILISTRQRVAMEYTTSNGAKQMPCTSSTLTKRLYFTS